MVLSERNSEFQDENIPPDLFRYDHYFECSLNFSIIMLFIEACFCFVYPCASIWARIWAFVGLSPTPTYLSRMLIVIAVVVVSTAAVTFSVLVGEDIPEASRDVNSSNDAHDSDI
ncbi:hypothetical protein AAVH_35406 [Aphelenchoides avenae]|nr:hypothetical protein AAVH_35406 [Aphelenchus avenae]